MKILVLILLVSALVVLGTCSRSEVSPPTAKVIPHELESHGTLRVDDYYWLSDRDAPEVVAYLEAENTYADRVMADTADLQQTLFDELTGRVRQTDSTVPVLKGGHLYYSRTVEGEEYPIHCRRADRDGAPEEILLDVNALAEGFEYCSVKGLGVAAESDVMVYAIDTVGRRKYTLRFKDLGTGELLDDEVADVTGESAWANDGRTIFYTRQDPDTLRAHQVWRHVLGSDPSRDELVTQEDDPTFSLEIAKTTSESYIIVTSEHTLTTEVRIIDADDPEAQPVVIAPRERGVEYHVAHQGDRFLIRTNLDAVNFRLMEAPVAEPGRSSWRELVPHRNDVLLEDVQAFRDFIVLSERAAGSPRLQVVSTGGGEPLIIDGDESACEIWVDDNRRFDSRILRYGTSSLTTPESIFDLDMVTGERELRKRQEILGGFDPEDYVSERIMVPARDGVEVPLSVVRRADLAFDGQAPLLLYAYGSYGYSTGADFDPEIASLLERGFSYAIAHVRGGQEMGRQWYEDGKLLKKMNTFTDFIDCARYLIYEGYTSPERLVAQGRSAGGLLMGAVSNLEPELFAGIVANVPFVDVVTTMLDESIPLTTSEFDEWGNPADPEYYDYMLSYSPYDQVEAKSYPALMVTAGLHDSQVQYWEPAKWVAKLRAMKTDDRLLIFRTRIHAGHGGASGRYDSYRERAEELAFMITTVED
ncbi:MAG: S9 family peptidase [Thermoanaerobaculales bacterium]|jgi:oligopeptidase B|nr:S9 family peptidase [Thermoanaerobaculales bacterium]